MTVKNQWLRKTPLGLWLGGLFFLPLIFWPWSPIPFEIPRVWFVIRWVEALVLVGLIALRTDIQQRSTNKVWWLALGLGVVAILASRLGLDWALSVWGNPYRSDGLITLGHLIGLSSWLWLFWQPRWLRPTLLVTAVSATIINLLAIGQWLGFYVFQFDDIQLWQGAVGTVFGQPNFMGGYLLVTLPVWGYFAQQKWQLRQRWWVLGGGLQVAAIATTLSVGSLMGVGLLAVSWWLLLKKRTKLLPIVIIIWVLTFNSLSIWSQRASQTLESRERIFRKLLMAAQDRPFLGWGWANVYPAFKKHDWPVPVANEAYVDKAHSQVLEVLVTMGGVGLLSYLWLLRATWKEVSSTPVLLLMLVLYLYHSQTNVISIAEEFWLWTLVGVAGATQRRDS